ncbi:probable leucine--tRNA ligase, mitochondrial [Haliotis rubra]|uniref:probable leucine--tRNA ligase, mitochondrial n=1 Tax=Haliotis rubra TaxID=36100 RepID=UPI001EE618CE|nr:probable leucine--tRNA ligase, mitochondrial [Haliotis rubra]
MMSSKTLTWSTLKYLRLKINYSNSCRSIFSKTGQWEKAFNLDVRQAVESHWHPILNQQNSSKHLKQDHIKTDRPKQYVLSMFPYPSGKLHMGHVRVYTISDVMARYHRLTGKEVIHPMGWDAFGLPAENAAIERGERPDVWTYGNIESTKKQLDELGCSFDWERELATCHPQYYRWTQYLFLKMFEAGLVYQKDAEVNWDPVDQTVLADEQISDAGISWRSGAKVEKRYLRQWYIRTTAYAQSLWDGLEEVNKVLWKDVVQLQRHWIGECNGCRFDFKLKLEGEELPEPLSVFTDSPELVYGASHICLSPEHRFNSPQYCQEHGNPKDESVTIVTRLRAVHPLTGEELPVVVSDAVQYDEFNDTHIGIPSKSEVDQQVAGSLGFEWTPVSDDTQGTIVNSQEFSGLTAGEARKAIMEHAKTLGVGGHAVSSRLRDWLISRQRYWGTPIPIIHCPSCKAVPVPKSDLPVELPVITQLTGRGASPLASDEEWGSVNCPKCGGPARRETDTMDTFVDSSWYFVRFLDYHNTKEPFRQDLAHHYMPVDLYIGGKEHAVLHLYFARFFNHFLHSLDLVPQREPFINLLTQGMVMGQTFRVKGTGRYIQPKDVDFSGSKPVEKETGNQVVVDWEKMSKSKHNGVDPQEVMSEFGIDSTRLCILSNVAPQSNRKWSNEEFKGILHWQGRMWALVADLIEQCRGDNSNKPSQEDIDKVNTFMFENRNYFLKEVSFHMGKTFLLNAAISRLQGLTNALKKTQPTLMRHSVQFERGLCDLVVMMAPLAPHLASEMWAGLASIPNKHCHHYLWDKGVLEQAWPDVDQDYPLPLVIKINGQESSQVFVARQQLEALTLEAAHDLVKMSSVYQEYCEGRELEDVQFHMEPGYEAVIDFSVPSTGQRKEKLTKQEKKLRKKEMQLKKKQMKQQNKQSVM